MPFDPDTDESDDDCLFEPLDTHYSHLAAARAPVDLRKHPRFDTGFPAEAISENGCKTLATITNLSRSGLRLEGNRQMLDALFPGYNRQTGHTPAPLQVDFAVPDGADCRHVIKVQCKSVYIQQEETDIWKIGMQIAGFSEGREALMVYLLHREETG